MKTSNSWLRRLLGSLGGPNEGQQTNYKIESREALLIKWRKYGFECAQRGVSLEDVLSKLHTEMSGRKLNVSANKEQHIIQLTKGKKDAEKQLARIEANPEFFIQNAISNLPSRDHRKVSKLKAKQIELAEQIKYVDIELKKTLNSDVYATQL